MKKQEKREKREKTRKERKTKNLKKERKTRKKGKTRKTRKSQKEKEEFKKLSCTPARKNRKGAYSCYSDDSLHYLKKMWNIRHPDDPINTNDAREIWKNLKENMRGVCSEEACWMRQEFTKNKITPEMLHYTFMPAAPETWKKNKNTWLTSTDISRVMLQYEHKYPHFAFI